MIDYSEETRIRSYLAYPSTHGEIRLVQTGGGPGGIEFIVDCSEEGASLAVWNPFRHEWAVLKMVGMGDSRRPHSPGHQMFDSQPTLKHCEGGDSKFGRDT